MIRYSLLFITFAIFAVTAIAEDMLPIDQQMYSLSEETGGRFYFWSPGEYASGKYGFYPEGIDEDVLLHHSGDSPIHETVLSVNIESNIKKLHVFIGAQKIESVMLIDSSGTTMNSKKSPHLNRSKHMLFGSIDHPRGGLWTLKLKSKGKRIIQLAQPSKDSPHHLKLFNFLRFIPVIPHADYFPRRSVPSSGKTRACSVELSQYVSDISVSFESVDGEKEMLQGKFEELDGGKIYIGSCDVPEGKFRAVIKGRTQQGEHFRRTYPVVMSEGKVILPFGAP